MDLACIIRRQYESVLQELGQRAKALHRARGKPKKGLERQFNQQVKQLLTRVQGDWPGWTSRNAVVTALYQESGLTDEMLANAVRAAWQEYIVQQQTRDALAEQSKVWNVSDLLNTCAKPSPDLTKLPLGAWFLQFDFQLASPYISHDDESNYLIDNPVTKDRVFGLPLIRPSSWKGNLRSALRLVKKWKNDDQAEMIRLFGNPKGAESEFRAGRLECFPTFFYRIGLEIINPHDRARKVGKNPILIECVPAGAHGTFSLLYVPFDLIGGAAGKIAQQAKEDLQLVAEAVRAMMLTYGFSAKRTSGYGVAKESVENGFVQIHIEEAPLPSASVTQTATTQPLPKYLEAPGKLKDEYLNPDGTFRERSTQELAKMTKPQRQEYEKAKKWWEREGRALLEKPAAPEEPQQPPQSQPQWLRRKFSSFDELVSIAEQLVQGGEA